MTVNCNYEIIRPEQVDENFTKSILGIDPDVFERVAIHNPMSTEFSWPNNHFPEDQILRTQSELETLAKIGNVVIVKDDNQQIAGFSIVTDENAVGAFEGKDDKISRFIKRFSHKNQNALLRNVAILDSAPNIQAVLAIEVGLCKFDDNAVVTTLIEKDSPQLINFFKGLGFMVLNSYLADRLQEVVTLEAKVGVVREIALRNYNDSLIVG